MDLLIILTYVAFAWAMFKIFKIPAIINWTIPTAALGRQIDCQRFNSVNEL